MESNKHKKRYSKISVEKRIRLVRMVLEEGVTITKAAKMLHVKRPTAKIIIKRYQNSGTFFHKKMPIIKSKPDASKIENTKVEENSIDVVFQENQGSPSIKTQPNQSGATQIPNPYIQEVFLNFIWLYRPFYDQQCFM